LEYIRNTLGQFPALAAALGRPACRCRWLGRAACARGLPASGLLARCRCCRASLGRTGCWATPAAAVGWAALLLPRARPLPLLPRPRAARCWAVPALGRARARAC